MTQKDIDRAQRFMKFFKARTHRHTDAGSRKGPIKWCKRCGRKHRPGDYCNLYLRTRTAKSGRKVKRWAH